MNDAHENYPAGPNQDDPEDKLRLRLYITRGASNSVSALANLDKICRRYFPNRHELEVIDILAQPGRALADGILLTPTLVKLAPSPIARIVGDLSHTEKVLQMLGVRGEDRHDATG